MDFATDALRFQQLLQLRDKLRRNVYEFGTSGVWHIRKAEEILDAPNEARRVSRPMDDDEIPPYIEKVSQLLPLLRQQEARCSDLWDRHRYEAPFLEARERQISLFESLEVADVRYERLVRYTATPILDQARQMLCEKYSPAESVTQIESIARMPLRSVVEHDNSNRKWLAQIDRVAESVTGHHREWALELAEQRYPGNKLASWAAVRNLPRAIMYYDPRRKYTFRMYAVHGIHDAMDRAMRMLDSLL